MSKRVNRGVKGQSSKHPKQSKAYLDFLRLVEEGNTEKLTAYFSRYGIDSSLAKLNLNALVTEELKDLSM
jgi:hypothetical protein